MKTIFDDLYQEGLRRAPAALQRMGEALQKPPEPIMSQEEFDALPHIKRCMLGCNMPGCGKVVSTHHMLCVDHIVSSTRRTDIA